MAEGQRITTLYFADIFLSKKDPNLTLKKVLTDFLSKKIPIPDYSNSEYEWYFTDLELKDESVLTGTLAKVEKIHQISVIDSLKNRILYNKSQVKDSLVEHSNYWIFLDKNLLVFERRRDIGEIQFQEALKKGFQIYFKSKIQIETKLKEDKKEIYRIIKSADKFISIELNVRPTNPSPFSDSDKMDKAIKEIKAKKLKFLAENKEKGLDLKKEKTLTRSGIALSDRKYGSYKGTYLINKEKYYFDSKKPVVKEPTVLPSEKNEMYQKILDIVDKILKGVQDE